MIPLIGITFFYLQVLIAYYLISSVFQILQLKDAFLEIRIIFSRRSVCLVQFQRGVIYVIITGNLIFITFYVGDIFHHERTLMEIHDDVRKIHAGDDFSGFQSAMSPISFVISKPATSVPSYMKSIWSSLMS